MKFHYDFSVDHSAFEKEAILNIHEYLMKKNKIKWNNDIQTY